MNLAMWMGSKRPPRARQPNETDSCACACFSQAGYLLYPLLREVVTMFLPRVYVHVRVLRMTAGSMLDVGSDGWMDTGPGGQNLRGAVWIGPFTAGAPAAGSIDPSGIDRDVRCAACLPACLVRACLPCVRLARAGAGSGLGRVVREAPPKLAKKILQTVTEGRRRCEKALSRCSRPTHESRATAFFLQRESRRCARIRARRTPAALLLLQPSIRTRIDGRVVQLLLSAGGR